MIHHLIFFKSSSSSQNQNEEFMNFTRFEVVLNKYLSLTSQVITELDEESQMKQRKCVQSLFYSLYYYFNAKFSFLFERHLKIVNGNLTDASLRDEFNNELIDETIHAIKSNYNLFVRNEHSSSLLLNETENLRLLQMPIRNINDYVRKYKISKNRHIVNKTLCEPVPPILCKLFKFIRIKFVICITFLNFALYLDGKHEVVEKKLNDSSDLIEDEDKNVFFGGMWSPPNCQARHKVSC